MERKQRGLVELAAGFLCYATGFIILLPYATVSHRTIWLPIIPIIAGVILILAGMVDCSS